MWLCLRTVLGPTAMSYTELTDRGLAGLGYVKVSGVELFANRAVPVVHRDPITKQVGPWEGVFVPAGPAVGNRTAGRYRLLMLYEDIREQSEVDALGDEHDVVGFVDNVFPRLSPLLQVQAKSLTGAIPGDCWVVRAKQFSWARGFGLTIAAMVIPAAYIMWTAFRPRRYKYAIMWPGRR